MYIGLPANNPKGVPRWTGPYLDSMSFDWMISLNHPVYFNGKYIASVGMDLFLYDFYDRSFSNVLDGTYNIIFQDDGRLITHPQYMDEIKAAKGEYFIQKQNDEKLKDIYHQVKDSAFPVILDEKICLFGDW